MPTVRWEPREYSSSPHYFYLSLERFLMTQTMDDLHVFMLFLILEGIDQQNGGVLSICMTALTMMSIEDDLHRMCPSNFYPPEGFYADGVYDEHALHLLRQPVHSSAWACYHHRNRGASTPMPYKGLTAVIEALVFSHGFRIFAEKPARGRLGAARKPARGATHIFAETGARIFAEAGARILAEAGARIFAEAGARILAEAGARIFAEAGARILAEAGARIFAEAGARIFAEASARIFAVAGARILAEAGARILAEAGAQTSGSAGARTRKPARGDD